MLSSGVLYTLLDLLNAFALGTVVDSQEAVSTRLFTSPRRNNRLDATTISAAYLLQPFTVAACLGRTTNIFTNTAIVHAVSSAVQGQSFRTMLALAMASYLSMYPALLLPPLLLLCWDRSHRSGTAQFPRITFVTNQCAIFLLAVNGFLWLSYFLMGWSWDFLSATYGVQLLVPDLTPNIGLWWYFFIEMFDSFRPFFLGVFWLHLAGYVGGLTLRLRRQPLFVVTSLLGLFAIFKPYPSISDVSLYFAFLPLYKHVFPCKPKASRTISTSWLTSSSDALHVRRHIGHALFQFARACVLLPVGICGFRECQFLLCHHARLESWALDPLGRLSVRGASR